MRGMRLGLGFGRGNGTTAAFTVSLGAGDITSGDALTATISPDPAPAVPTFQWTDDGVDISGATTNPDTFTIGSDGVANVSLIQVVATIDGTPYTSNARRILHPVPVLGTLAAQTVNAALTGVQYDLSGEVTFAGTPVYSIVAGPDGVTIGSDGIVDFDTEDLVLQVATSVTVRVADAAEPTRFDQESFNLTVAAAPSAMAAPTVASLSASSFRITKGADPAANNSAITSYDAQYSTSPDMAGAVTLTSFTSPVDVTGVPASTTYYARTRAVNALGAGAWGAIDSATTATPTTAVLTKVSEDFAAATALITITHVGGAGETVYWEFHNSATPPARGAGSLGSGTAGTLGGSLSIDLAAFVLDSGYIHVNAGEAPGESNSLTYGPITVPDLVAPVLSLPTGAADGATGATTLGVTTDEAGGTLYWGLYPTASTPTAAQVVAGTGAVSGTAGSQAVTVTGVQSVSNQTGLTASTAYKAHYVQDDASANRSNLSTSAEFTTSAASTALTITGNRTDGLLIDSGAGALTITGGRTDGLLLESA